MSELKDYRIPTRSGNVCHCYLKSEADKVIAEQKEKLVEQVTLRAWAELQLRHQKYKRCLDKANLCEARYDEEDAKVNGCWASWEYISKEMKYWERWQKRWLELAEKFKEAK